VVTDTNQEAFEALLATQEPLGLRRQIEAALGQVWRLREGADQAVAPATAGSGWVRSTYEATNATK
jgi:hypothetical protein